MKIFRFLPALFALLFAAGLTGCSGPKPGGLSVAIINVQASEASLAQKQISITLRYSSENVTALGFSGAVHKVSLNGAYVGKTELTAPFGIPPVSSVTQEATVTIERPDYVRDLLARGAVSTISYHLESQISQTIYEDNYSYNLSAQGSVELHRETAAPAAK